MTSPVSDERLAEMKEKAAQTPYSTVRVQQREFVAMIIELQHLRSPVTVSDELVELAARAMWRASVPPPQENDFPEHACIARSLYMKSAFAALTAVLEGRATGEVRPTPGGDNRVVSYEWKFIGSSGEWKTAYNSTLEGIDPQVEVRNVVWFVPLSSLEIALKHHGRAEIYMNAAVGWQRRAETAEASLAAAREALIRQKTNIEHWLETGEAVGPEESKSIYGQICAALAGSNGE